MPKAGEFVIVSTDKKFDPSAELSLGLDDLLEVRRLLVLFELERETNNQEQIGFSQEIKQTQGFWKRSVPI